MTLGFQWQAFCRGWKVKRYPSAVDIDKNLSKRLSKNLLVLVNRIMSAVLSGT